MQKWWPVIIALAVLVSGPQVGLALALVAVSITLLLLRYCPKDTFLATVLPAALLCRVLLIAADTAYGLFPYAWDIELFRRNALLILGNLAEGAPILQGTTSGLGVKTYSLFVAVVYRTFGEQEGIVRALNALFGTLAVARIYQLSLDSIGEPRVARAAALLGAFLPSHVVFTSLNMRDALFLFFFVSSLRHIVRAIRHQRVWSSTVTAGLQVTLLYLLRPQSVIVLALALGLFFAARFLKRRELAALLLAAMPLLFAFSTINLHKLFVDIKAEMEWRAAGGAVYLKEMTYHSWFDIIRYLPLRFVHFTFGPFLGTARSPWLLLASLEGTVTLLFFALSLVRAARSRGMANFGMEAFLLFYCVLGLAAGAVVDSNYGTAIRHRLPYVAVLLIMAFASLFQKSSSRMVRVDGKGCPPISSGTSPLQP